MTYYIYRSTNASKKYSAVTEGKRKVDFGASGYEDYTIHKDAERKRRYILRHKARENWDNPETAGFWSRWLLWNLPTLHESAQDIERRYGLEVVIAVQS
jgi:hypothetical protein